MNRKILTVLFVCTYGCFAYFDESKSYNDAIHKLAGYLVRMEELAGKTVDFNLPDEKKKSDTSCFPSFEEKLIASGSSEFKDEDQISERVAVIESELAAEMRKLRKLNKMKHDEDEAKCKATQFLDNLGRMRDLAEKASGEILSDADRERVNKEFLESKGKIDKIASSYETELNEEQCYLFQKIIVDGFEDMIGN